MEDTCHLQPAASSPHAIRLESACWPQSPLLRARYLSDYEWDPRVPEEVKSFYSGRPNITATFSQEAGHGGGDQDTLSIDVAVVDEAQRQFPPVTLRHLTDPRHPAHGQYGLIATAEILPDSYVMDYVGIVSLEANTSKTSDYVLHMHGPLDVDAEMAGNEARFINDFRGVAKRPNAAFDTYRDARTGAVRIGVWSLSRRIMPGEELLVTYGSEYWASRGLVSAEPDWNDEWD